MPPFAKHKSTFARFTFPWLGCAMALCVTACNGNGVNDSALRDSDSQGSEEDDSSKPGDRTDADDDKKATNHKPQSTDTDEAEEGEKDVTPVARSCRTLDDCPEGEVCVLKRGDGFCELGVAEARGPLGQPPPPLGLVEGGFNFDGEDAK